MWVVDFMRGCQRVRVFAACLSSMTENPLPTPPTTWLGKVRDRVAYRVACAALRCASPWYRGMVDGSIRYGLASVQRDVRDNRPAPTGTTDVTIYGANDDLVEVRGAIDGAGEYTADGPWLGTLVSPDGDALIVEVEFDRRDSDSEWTIAVRNTGTFPGWPIRFATRPDREDDPAVVITVPAGTVLNTA